MPAHAGSGEGQNLRSSFKNPRKLNLRFLVIPRPRADSARMINPRPLEHGQNHPSLDTLIRLSLRNLKIVPRIVNAFPEQSSPRPAGEDRGGRKRRHTFSLAVVGWVEPQAKPKVP